MNKDTLNSCSIVKFKGIASVVHATCAAKMENDMRKSRTAICSEITLHYLKSSNEHIKPIVLARNKTNRTQEPTSTILLCI